MSENNALRSTRSRRRKFHLKLPQKHCKNDLNLRPSEEPARKCMFPDTERDTSGSAGANEVMLRGVLRARGVL